MSVIVNRPAVCLTRPLRCLHAHALQGSWSQRPPTHKSYSLRRRKYWGIHIEWCGFPEQVPAAPQGKGPRPHLLRGTPSLHHPPRVAINHCLYKGRARRHHKSERQTGQTGLPGKCPIILLCEVSRPTMETQYTTSNAVVGAAAKLIGIDGKEMHEGERIPALALSGVRRTTRDIK